MLRAKQPSNDGRSLLVACAGEKKMLMFAPASVTPIGQSKPIVMPKAKHVLAETEVYRKTSLNKAGSEKV